jgi:hypothetical protein
LARAEDLEYTPVRLPSSTAWMTWAPIPSGWSVPRAWQTTGAEMDEGACRELASRSRRRGSLGPEERADVRTRHNKHGRNRTFIKGTKNKAEQEAQGRTFSPNGSSSSPNKGPSNAPITLCLPPRRFFFVSVRLFPIVPSSARSIAILDNVLRPVPTTTPTPLLGRLEAFCLSEVRSEGFDGRGLGRGEALGAGEGGKLLIGGRGEEDESNRRV